jgi:hypothetical protein
MNPTWLYLAALYALAVWLARRARVELPVRVALFFYGLVLIFLFRALTQHYVNLPVDIVLTLPPWHAVTPKMIVRNFEMNDIVMQIVPWAHQVREAWKAGTLPLWNPLAGCGYPLLANGQSSGFSPMRILALPLRLEWSFAAEAGMKMLVAMTFTFLYGRRRGWSELPSVAAAVSFGFCTFVQTWLHFPLVTVGCFIPAVFLHVDQFFDGVTRRRFLFAVVLWTTMFFGGHPETVSHAAFIAGLYVAFIVAVERPRMWRENLRVIRGIFVAGLLSVFIATPFLLPFLEAVRKSQRFQELQVQPNAVGYYSDLPSEIILMAPHFFGHVPHEKAWGPAVAESITGFAGVFGLAAWVGLLLRALARQRLREQKRTLLREREAFFLIATPIVLGIILAWPIVSTAFHFVFKLAANARLRLLLCWCVAAMTGAMLDVLLRERRSWHLLIGVGVVAGVMLKLLHYMPFPSDAARDTAVIAFLPSLLVLAVATLYALPLRFRPHVTAALLVALVAELWSASEGWNPTLPQSLSYPKTPLITRLEELRKADGPAGPYRVTGLGPSFFPNANALFNFEDIRAHDPMAYGSYLGFLRVMVNYNTSDYFAKWDDPNTALLDYLNVKYVTSDAGMDIADSERYQKVYDAKDGTIFVNHHVLPRFFAARNVIIDWGRDYYMRKLMHHDDWHNTALLLGGIKLIGGDRERHDLLDPRPSSAPAGRVTMLPSRDTDFRMHVTAPRYTLIVSSMPLWPGWHVTHNGRSLEPFAVNGPFLGFVVPPGTGEVRVHYAPLSFYAGLALSLVTLAGLGVTFARSRRRPLPAAEAAAATS